MYKLKNLFGETLGEAKTLDEAKEVAEKLSYKGTVFLESEKNDDDDDENEKV